jgi:hypothetical protein
MVNIMMVGVCGGEVSSIDSGQEAESKEGTENLVSLSKIHLQ